MRVTNLLDYLLKLFKQRGRLKHRAGLRLAPSCFDTLVILSALVLNVCLLQRKVALLVDGLVAVLHTMPVVCMVGVFGKQKLKAFVATVGEITYTSSV